MGRDDDFLLPGLIIYFTALRRSDPYLGATSSANRCLAAMACVDFSLHVHIKQTLSPKVYGKHVMALNVWSFLGTKIPTSVFQSLLNPIFWCSCPSKFILKWGNWSKMVIFLGGWPSLVCQWFYLSSNQPPFYHIYNILKAWRSLAKFFAFFTL